MIWCLSRRQNSLKEDILIGRHGKMTLMLWEMCKMLVIFNNFCKRHRLQMFRFLDVWKTILNIYISYHSAIFMLDILVNNQPRAPIIWGRPEPTAITHEKKGKWSEPNLQGIMFHLFIFRGIKTFGESPLLWCKQTCSKKTCVLFFLISSLLKLPIYPIFGWSKSIKNHPFGGIPVAQRGTTSWFWPLDAEQQLALNSDDGFSLDKNNRASWNLQKKNPSEVTCTKNV